MKQGDIYLARLSPVEGSEQGGVRPVLIISGNMMNAHVDVVICCPLSAQIKHYPGGVILEASEDTGLSKDAEVLTAQIRTIAKKRLVKHIGSVKRQTLGAVKGGLLDVLTY